MKTNSLLESWFENSKVAMQPALELTEITKRALEKANEQNLAIAKDYLDFSLRGFKLLGTIHDPRALIEQQVELAKEVGEKTFAAADAYAKLTSETQTQFTRWTEKTSKAVVAQAGEATEAAVASAEKALKRAA